MDQAAQAIRQHFHNPPRATPMGALCIFDSNVKALIALYRGPVRMSPQPLKRFRSSSAVLVVLRANGLLKVLMLGSRSNVRF